MGRRRTEPVRSGECAGLCVHIGKRGVVGRQPPSLTAAGESGPCVSRKRETEHGVVTGVIAEAAEVTSPGMASPALSYVHRNSAPAEGKAAYVLAAEGCWQTQLPLALLS